MTSSGRSNSKYNKDEAGKYPCHQLRLYYNGVLGFVSLFYSINGGHMIRRLILGICCMLLLGACSRGLSPEEQAQVQMLRSELDATKKEVVAATNKDAQYSGGVIKAFTTLRVEILKTNEALLQQRIQAIESGAKITIQPSVTAPDPGRAKALEEDLAKQEKKLEDSLSRAQASGGLIGAMAHMAAATEANTLSLLRQQYLVAKYGLASPNLGVNVATPSSPDEPPSAAAPKTNEVDIDEQQRSQIVTSTLLRKQYAKQDYQDFIWFDLKFDAVGLDKPARAIKGRLVLTDLFGEQKFAIRWTVDRNVAPGASFTEKGTGFEFNQFTDSHQWVRSTDFQNMKAKFLVDSILYEDGSLREF